MTLPLQTADCRPASPAPWTDAEIDGEIALLPGPRPVRLSGVGATLWLAAREVASIGALVAYLEQRHGPHPDAREITRTTVRDLAELGALSWRPSQQDSPSCGTSPSMR